MNNRRYLYRLYRAAWTGLDWIYPPRCGGCEQRGSRWCPECRQQVERLLPPYCPVCGAPSESEACCPHCQTSAFHYSALRSFGYFSGPLRAALHKLKYRGDIALGEILAQELIELYAHLSWRVDFVTPVPIGVERLTERGYNQAALLALPLALATGLKYEHSALHKIRSTQSQVGLDRFERIQNVAGAFQGDRKKVQNNRVLVIDDVVTTGATLDACSTALLAAGAQEVFCFTLARAKEIEIS